MSKLKIATLHCFGSNPHKHATQRFHFTHCAQACRDLAEWQYPAGPLLLTPEQVRHLLASELGCSAEEVEAFGFEDPRAWFRAGDGRYAGLDDSMAYLAEWCRRERPDGIAGYSNGGVMAMLVAAARERGDEAFQSIRFLMCFASPTSPLARRHVREHLGAHDKITIPSLIVGSQHDPLLAGAHELADDLLARCQLVLSDERRPYANHALPDAPQSYARVLRFIEAQRR